MIRPELTENVLNRYRYWRQFLLRSERYKKLCATVEEIKEEHPWHDQFIKLWCPVVKSFDRGYFYWKNEHIRCSDRIYDKNKGTTYGDILEGVFPLFQNIFNEGFEDVKRRVDIFYQFAPFYQISFIKPALEDIFLILQRLPLFHSSRLDDKVCARDILLALFDHFETELEDLNMFTIDTFGYGKTVLNKEFSKLYDELTKNNPRPQWTPPRWELYLNFKRCNFAKFDDILRAFDAKQRYCRAEAIKTTFPGDDRDLKTIEDHYDRLNRQALRLIENAESGDFPGDYGK